MDYRIKRNISDYYLYSSFCVIFYPGFIDNSPGNIKTSMGLETRISHTPLNIFCWGGVAGVCIFFTISGFLIAYNFYKKKQLFRTGYIIKRYLKLMLPVLISSLIVFFIIKSQLFRTDHLIKLYDKIGLNNNYREYNSNFLTVCWEALVTLFRTSSFPLNPPMWAMKYELIYSITSALLLNVIGKSKNRYILYSMLFLISINSYFQCFISGIILCDLWINHNKVLDYLNHNDLKILILGISLFLLSSTYANQGTLYYSMINNLFNDIDYLVVFHSLGATFLILFFLISKKGKQLFSTKVFVYFGNQSLFIYLFHWVVINTFSMYIVLLLHKHLKYYKSSLISFVITFIVVLFFSNYFGKYITKLTNIIVNKVKDKLVEKEEL